MSTKLCSHCSSIPWGEFLSSIEDGSHKAFSFSYRPAPNTSVGNDACSICKVLFSTRSCLGTTDVTVRISSLYDSGAPSGSRSSHAKYLALRFALALSEQHSYVTEFNVCAVRDQMDQPAKTPVLGRLVQDPIVLGPQSICGSWFQSCTETHGECMDIQGFNAILPTRILDIGRKGQDRISLLEVSAGSKGQYAALSHCWGAKQTFRTSLANVENRKKSIDFRELPQTFQDAISVSRSLRLQYLWIDSLCIIQDDWDDWKRESVKMEQVYSMATVVICASRASSDASGFLNHRKLGETIKITHGEMGKGFECYLQHALQSLNSYETSLKSAFADPLLAEPLHQRGWALQERYLPQRTLYFGSHQMFWNCKTICQSEDGRTLKQPWFDVKDMIPVVADVVLKKTWASDKQLQMFWPWYKMIERYMSCKLSYESDRLLAIAGLAKSVWLQSKDSYLAGLWRSSSIVGLLWRKYKLASLERPSAYRAPSWSWASVEGDIEFSIYTWFNSFPHGIEYFASVKDVQVDVDNDPFGTVSGGWLSIDAVTLPIVGSRGPFTLEQFPELSHAGSHTINTSGPFHRVFDWLFNVRFPENDALIAGTFDYPEDYDSTNDESLFAVFLAGVPPLPKHASHNEGLFGLVLKKHEGADAFTRVGMLHGKFMVDEPSRSDQEMFSQYRSWKKQDALSSVENPSQAAWCDMRFHERERKTCILR